MNRIGDFGFLDALRIQLRVIGALILRDMRTRFGRTYLTYAVAVAWPLLHLLAILITYILAHSLVVPVGTDITVFPATGMLPYILCLYPARMICLSIVVNRPLLTFPIISTSDLIISRSVLEIVTAFLVVVIFISLIYIWDKEIWPPNPSGALVAICATLFYSVSFGYLSAVIFALWRPWLATQIVLLIIMYLASGAFFIPEALPKGVQAVLWFNPLLHCVEWLRSAYYEQYGTGILDKRFLIGVSMFNLFLGLALERLTRGRLLLS